MTRRDRIPLALKLAYTLFVAILVPYYWVNFSAWNFLFFCDLALLMTLPALWLESSRLMSIPAVGLALPQLLWMADFVAGARITGITSYMFDPNMPLFGRGLSLFHFWLPILMVWGVWRLGYHRPALLAWTGISTAVLLICYFLAPAPPAPASNPNLAVNVNFVHGLSYDRPQTWLPPWLWLTGIIVVYPIGFYVPSHLIFRSLFARPAGAAAASEEGIQLAMSRDRLESQSATCNFPIDPDPSPGIRFG